jgi:hypothetical protein
MSTYDGPAWVTSANGQEIEVHAVLHDMTDTRSGLRSWDGTLTGPADWFTLMGETIKLRIGDRSGEFLLRHSDLARPDAPVSIQGSGPAPFA